MRRHRARGSRVCRSGCVALFPALLLGCGGGGGGSGGSPTATASSSHGLRVELEFARAQPPSSLVSVFFGVETDRGEPVSDLTAEDFEILEDGKRVSFFESSQQISPREKAFRSYTLLLLDLSGSVLLSGSLAKLKEASASLVDEIFSTEEGDVHRLGVQWFDGSATVHNALGSRLFTAKRQEVLDAIDALQGSDDLSTNLHGAVVQGLQILDDARQAQSPDMITHGNLVLFTDGTDNAGWVNERVAFRTVDRSDDFVFTIGLGGEIDGHSLGEIGKDGMVFARNLGELFPSFQRIARSIRDRANSFYLLEYCSPKRAGKHDLTVRAVRKEASASLTTTFVANGFTAACAASGVLADAIGFVAPGRDEPAAVAVGPDGSLVLAGEFQRSLRFDAAVLRSAGGAGDRDAFVARLFEDGTVDWAQSIAGDIAGTAERATAVALGPAGEVAVAGTTTGSLKFPGFPLGHRGERDAFVVLFDSSGRLLWARGIAGPGDDRASSVAVVPDPSGADRFDVVVGGEFSSTATFVDRSASSAGKQDAFLCRLRGTDGRLEWRRRMGGAEDDAVWALSPFSDGSLLVAGSFGAIATFGLGFELSSPSGPRGFAARYRPVGSPRWVVLLEPADSPPASSTRGDAAAVGDGDAAYVAGVATVAAAGGGEETNGLVARLSTTGAEVWSSSFGPIDPATRLAMAISDRGAIAITGAFRDATTLVGPSFSGAGERDVFFLQLAETGGVPRNVFSRVWGAGGDDFGSALAVGSAGDVRVAGRFSATVDFESTPLTGSGDGAGDVFLVHIR